MKRPFLLLLLISLIAIGLHAEENPRIRFQIEFYGGFSTANPEDLNLALDAEEELNNFYYNNSYSYLESIDYINSYSYKRQGSYNRIDGVMPFGLRIKANVGSTFAFSLGLRYMSGTQKSYPREEFSAIENSGSVSTEVLEYSPLQLNMSGMSVQIGIHAGRNFGRKFRVEGYLSAGPVFGEFSYSYLLKNDLNYGDSGLAFSTETSQGLKGKGSGFAVDVGAQVYMNLTEHFRAFLMGSYSHQRLNSLSGDGEQNIFGFPEYWEGEICLIKEPQRAPWGTKDIVYLSNNDLLIEYYKERNMRLDLSGFSISIGIAFRI